MVLTTGGDSYIKQRCFIWVLNYTIHWKKKKTKKAKKKRLNEGPTLKNRPKMPKFKSSYNFKSLLIT
jgi:hypothetical protein